MFKASKYTSTLSSIENKTAIKKNPNNLIYLIFDVQYSKEVQQKNLFRKKKKKRIFKTLDKNNLSNKM